MRILLIALAALFAAAPSCQETNTQTPKAKTQEPNQAAQPKFALTRESVIEVANAEMRRLGMNISQYDVLFDQGNLAWNSAMRSIRIELPELAGHDFQAVKYTLRDRKTVGADVFIFIDKTTGKPLTFLQVEGRAQTSDVPPGQKPQTSP
jgi:hypothetical protein